jgi:hypothetical protein
MAITQRLTRPTDDYETVMVSVADENVLYNSYPQANLGRLHVVHWATPLSAKTALWRLRSTVRPLGAFKSAVLTTRHDITAPLKEVTDEEAANQQLAAAQDESISFLRADYAHLAMVWYHSTLADLAHPDRPVTGFVLPGIWDETLVSQLIGITATDTLKSHRDELLAQLREVMRDFS